MLRINTAADANYYLGSASERESAGAWDGILAMELGLSDAGDLRPLLDRNRTPEGQRLTPIDQANRRGGYDLTFSEPKSVSIMEQVIGDKRIGQARRDSVDEIMRTLVEPLAATRVWNGKNNQTVTTGNLAYLPFDHLLARPHLGMPDPNGHVHVVVANATAWKGKRTALEIRPIKEAAPFIEAAWHALYAEKLKGLGYGIRPTRTAFEIEGVSDQIIKKYSNRTATVEGELERRQKALSEQLSTARSEEELRLLEGRIARLKSPKGKSALGALTRQMKQPELSQEAIDAEWRNRLTPAEVAGLYRLTMAPEPEAPKPAFGFRPPWEPRQKPAAEPAAPEPDKHAAHLSASLKSLLKADSRVTEERLLTHALKAGVGEVTLSGLRDTLESDHFRDVTNMVTAGGLVSTRPMLKAEAEVVDYARGGRLHWVKGRVQGLPDAGKLSFPDLWEMVRQAGDKHLVIAGDARGQREGQPLKILRDWADMRPIGENATPKKPVVVRPKLTGWKRAMGRQWEMLRRITHTKLHAAEVAIHERAERQAGRGIER